MTEKITKTEQPYRSGFSFENKWSSGVCDCCEDCGTCCCAIWCYPCFLCSLDKSNQECICTSLGISLLLGGPCSGLAMMRTKVRTSYKIEGSIFDDYLYACCCSCCTAIQIYRELKFKGEI